VCNFSRKELIYKFEEDGFLITSQFRVQCYIFNYSGRAASLGPPIDVLNRTNH